MKQFTILFYPLRKADVVEIEFTSEKPVTDFLGLSTLEGYRMYQYIESLYTYNMSIEELQNKKVRFKQLHRKQKTWFGLFTKTVTDILIEPKDGFYYPYDYGNYLYIFTKENSIQSDFENWIRQEFPGRYADIDETFGGGNSGFLNLMHEDDYLIATNHDYQEQLGLSGKQSIIEQVLSKFQSANLKDYKSTQHIR